jgi:aminopeptidase
MQGENFMPDTRLQRIAQVLVRYSLGIKKGDRLAIETGPIAAPLVHEVVREALHAGAYPETFVALPGVRVFIKDNLESQLLTPAYPDTYTACAIDAFSCILMVG